MKLLKSMRAVFVFFGIALAMISPVTHARPFIETVEKIVFLGDSITYQGTFVSNFDIWLHTKYPDKEFTIINMGLPSENVSGLSEEGHANGAFPRPDLHARLDSVLAVTKPELIFACYGMNDGILMPFDEGRFQKFKDGIIKLKTKAEAAGAKIVFLTPPYFDPTGKLAESAHYTEVLAKYSAWLVSKRAEGWHVIDVNTAMTQQVLERRRREPAFTVQPDSVHPNALGHWFMTQPILAWLGDARAASDETLGEYMKRSKLAGQIEKLTQQRMTVRRDSWLHKAGFKRPGLGRGLPWEESEKRAAEITRELRALRTAPR